MGNKAPANTLIWKRGLLPYSLPQATTLMFQSTFRADVNRLVGESSRVTRARRLSSCLPAPTDALTGPGAHINIKPNHDEWQTAIILHTDSNIETVNAYKAVDP